MSIYKNEKAEYLQQAIDSMLQQSVFPDEIVLVKDGPLTDELDNVVGTYVKEFPNLFTIVVNEQNLGLGLALNNGLKACRNELVARMDTDDVSRKNRCELQLQAFANNPELDIVGAAVEEFSIDTNIIDSVKIPPKTQTEIYEFAKRRSAFSHPVVMYRKSSVLKFGGYSELRRNQDVDLFGRMLFGGCKALNLDEFLLLFRADDKLSRRRKSWQNSWSYIATIRKFWKMGYSSFWDYAIVAIAQTGMYLMPIKVQNFVYKRFLRK